MKLVLFCIIASVMITSCATNPALIENNIVLNVEKYKDEIVVSNNYRDKYKNRENIKIVIRVPGVSNTVTSEDTKSEFYIDLEKRLVQNGFIVRDSALIDTLLANRKDVQSYESIFKIIDTDIMLQIDKIDLNLKIFPQKYYINGEEKNEGNDKYYVNGAEISARVVAVNEGEVGIIAHIYSFLADKDNTIEYKYVVTKMNAGALGISPGQIKEEVKIVNGKSIYNLYSELINKLINTIRQE